MPFQYLDALPTNYTNAQLNRLGLGSSGGTIITGVPKNRIKLFHALISGYGASGIGNDSISIYPLISGGLMASVFLPQASAPVMPTLFVNQYGSGGYQAVLPAIAGTRYRLHRLIVSNGAAGGAAIDFQWDGNPHIFQGIVGTDVIDLGGYVTNDNTGLSWNAPLNTISMVLEYSIVPTTVGDLIPRQQAATVVDLKGYEIPDIGGGVGTFISGNCSGEVCIAYALIPAYPI